MESQLKEKLKADLDSLVNGQKVFQKVGQAWNLGYLLYGPPRTRKTSMSAAMVNYLKYNIYDLELNQVNSIISLLFFKLSILIVEYNKNKLMLT